MKFGKYVEENAVPEWASQYLSYKLLKKKIKQIVQQGIVTQEIQGISILVKKKE